MVALRRAAMRKQTLATRVIPRLALLAGLSMLPVQNVQAAEVKFLCAAALQPVMNELIPAFQKSSGDTVDIKYANISVNTQAVRSDEAADIVIVSPAQWAELVKEGKVDPDTKVEI